MSTADENGDLAVAVCPECDWHSVCDPAWLGIVGKTLPLCCENCNDDVEKEHEIKRFSECSAIPNARI